MKANEVRLGNYILKDDKVLRVVEINSIKIEAISMYEKHRVFYEYAKPIPLTEEWLLKFSFTQKLGNWELPNFRFHINKPMNYDGFLFCDGYSVITDKIHYVHQLQNLIFSLCGEELELKEKM